MLSGNERKGLGAFFFWGIIFVLGVAGWLWFVFYGDPSRAWRVLLVNFIFFTPLATGLIVWPAVVIASQGVWAKPIERVAFSSLPFAFISIASFIVLWIGHPHWAVWANVSNLPQGFWLNNKFVFIRDISALVIIWIMCSAFVTRARKSASAKLAGWLMFTYAVVFTLLSFDMVMALDPHWFSTLFGGYFFVSGMYAALAVWTVLSILSGSAAIEHRHDLAKLIVAVSLLTTYLMFSQLLPIWYEDLSAEVRFIIPRLTISQWRYISVILVVTIYLGPLVLLLTTWSKRSPVFLTIVSLLMLAGLWVERWWEVTPALGGKLTFGLTELSITAAFTASFIISVIISKHRWMDESKRA
jgi:hypothetical protein